MSKTHAPPKVSTSITFEADQYTALAAEAERAFTSLSTIVRAIVRRWQLEQQATTGQEACHDH